jgi:hypothetical protein
MGIVGNNVVTHSGVFSTRGHYILTLQDEPNRLHLQYAVEHGMRYYFFNEFLTHIDVYVDGPFGKFAQEGPLCHLEGTVASDRVVFSTTQVSPIRIVDQKLRLSDIQYHLEYVKATAILQQVLTIGTVVMPDYIFFGVKATAQIDLGTKRDGAFALTVDKVRVADTSGVDAFAVTFGQKHDRGRYRYSVHAEVQRVFAPELAIDSFSGDLAWDLDAPSIDRIAAMLRKQEAPTLNQWNSLLVHGVNAQLHHLKGGGESSSFDISSNISLPTVTDIHQVSIKKNLTADLLLQTTGDAAKAAYHGLNNYFGIKGDDPPAALNLQFNLEHGVFSINHQVVSAAKSAHFLDLLTLYDEQIRSGL